MPIRKKSGNLFNDPRIYLSIYLSFPASVFYDTVFFSLLEVNKTLRLQFNRNLFIYIYLVLRIHSVFWSISPLDFLFLHLYFFVCFLLFISSFFGY